MRVLTNKKNQLLQQINTFNMFEYLKVTHQNTYDWDWIPTNHGYGPSHQRNEIN